MLAFLNAFADGYVAVPVLYACKKHGLFDILEENNWIETDVLVKRLKANAGYLKIALHLLESLGWLVRNEVNEYKLVEAAYWKKLPEGLNKLYEISPDKLFQSEKSQNVICFWINVFIENTNSTIEFTNLSWTDRFKGALFVPLFLALHQQSLILRDPISANLSLPLYEALIRLFVTNEWGKIDHDNFALTDAGNQLIEHAEVMGIAASYRPMLAKMEELIFGDAAKVFEKQLDGTESHIDRNHNVLASGFQHNRYFKDAEEQILTIFNQNQFEKQPRYIADMGCGDGTFLKYIYQTISENSKRGAVLVEHPLVLVGIDYNEIALKTAQECLKDLPHILLVGDINDPQQLLLDLQAAGIDDLNAVLHVRSFLDHNFNCSRKVTGKSVAANLPLLPGSIYIDTQGEPLLPSEVVTAWQEHLSRWSSVINSHGLMILEAHCLSVDWIQTYLGQSENFYFDHLHAFSRQYLIEAEAFLTLMAHVGLFPYVQPLRYPKTLPFCRVTLSHFEKRNYQIRHANQQDLEQLKVLEESCWPIELQASEFDLLNRINTYPQGQFVLEHEGDIIGVIYSQRIADQDSIFNMTVDTASRFHVSDGELVQLLSINILPKMHGKQFGNQLLEWMLQRCSIMNGVQAVVGVTICKNYHLQKNLRLDEYILSRDANGYLVDPILHFHESHGATIIGLVPNYRPNDVENEKQGVLVHYDIFCRISKKSLNEDTQRILPLNNVSNPILEDNVQDEISLYIEMLIRKCLRKESEDTFSQDKPLREMGLDSADVLEMTLQVARKFKLELNPVFFFRYNTAQRISAYIKEQMNINLKQKKEYAHETTA